MTLSRREIASHWVSIISRDRMNLGSPTRVLGHSLEINCKRVIWHMMMGRGGLRMQIIKSWWLKMSIDAIQRTTTWKKLLSRKSAVSILLPHSQRKKSAHTPTWSNKCWTPRLKNSTILVFSSLFYNLNTPSTRRTTTIKIKSNYNRLRMLSTWGITKRCTRYTPNLWANPMAVSFDESWSN